MLIAGENDFGDHVKFDLINMCDFYFLVGLGRKTKLREVEKFISNISRSLEELGQSEITSNTIGTMVMDGLKDLDPVAYVRFASVYRNFREEKDFIQFVDKIDVFKKR